MLEIEKAGQMAAWFLRRQGGRMPHLKLTKLLYLSERMPITQNNYPILGDKLVSMKHGPVLGMTLNYMRGYMEPDNGWDKWVAAKSDREVSLARQYRPEDLDMLSEAVLGVLETVWNQCGGMDQREIRDYTREHCAEWNDPRGYSFPITYKELFDVLGYEEKKSAEMASELEAQRQIGEVLSSCSFS